MYYSRNFRFAFPPIKEYISYLVCFRFDIYTKAVLLLDAGDVADGAAGGAGGEGGVGLESLRDLAGAGSGLPCRCAFGFHGGAAFGEFRVGEIDAEDTLGDVDLDGVALFDQGDGAAFCCFG